MSSSQSVAAQPQAAAMMTVTNPPVSESKQVDPEAQHCKHHNHKQSFISRLRGGGAGKDCFMGLVGCFLCFECCEGCCDCIGDIICCPCEMCC